MIKIAALADLHLGKKSTQASSGFPASTIYVLEKIVDYCIEQEIDILLMVGDIVDRENKYFEAHQPLENALKKLSENKICAYIVGGNHDFDTLPDILSTIKNTDHLFLGKGGKWESAVYDNGEEKLQIIGWSFPTEHFLQSPFNRFDKSSINPNFPQLGIVHGDFFDKSSQYAPLNPSDFVNSGINTWILGHIHKPGILNRNPLILYPGSPQALSPKEKGKHGIYTFELRGTIFTEPEFIQLSDIVYTNVEVDFPIDVTTENLRSHLLLEIQKKMEILRNQYNSIEYVIDLYLTGYSPDISALEEIANQLKEEYLYSGDFIIREVHTANLKPGIYDLEKLSARNDLLGALARLIENFNSDKLEDELTQELLKEVEKQSHTMLNNKTYLNLKRRNQKEPLIKKEDFKTLIKEEASVILAHFMEQLNLRDNE